MGRGACNIDLGKLFVIAFSGVDCESMSKDECKKEPGISCLWDDQTNKCTFDNMSYKDTEIIAQSLKDGRSQKLKDNAKVIAISVSLVFVGLIVVFIIRFCVYRPKQDNQVEM